MEKYVPEEIFRKMSLTDNLKEGVANSENNILPAHERLDNITEEEYNAVSFYFFVLLCCMCDVR